MAGKDGTRRDCPGSLLCQRQRAEDGLLHGLLKITEVVEIDEYIAADKLRERGGRRLNVGGHDTVTSSI